MYKQDMNSALATDSALQFLPSFPELLRTAIMTQDGMAAASLAIQFSVLSCHLLPGSELQTRCQAAQEMASQHCTAADLDAVFANEEARSLAE